MIRKHYSNNPHLAAMEREFDEKRRKTGILCRRLAVVGFCIACLIYCAHVFATCVFN